MNKNVLLPAVFLAAVSFASSLLHAQTVAPTPPMGWNSWDSYGLTIDEEQFKANASVLASVQQNGWKYAVIDEGWYMADPAGKTLEQKKYLWDANGILLPVESRFPSAAHNAGFKPLADWATWQARMLPDLSPPTPGIGESADRDPFSPDASLVTHTYGADGLRRKKESSSSTRNFVWDGRNMLQELDNLLATQAQYTDYPGAWGGLVSMRRGGASSFYGFDLQANARLLASPAGAITDSYAFKAFGELVASSGTTINPLQFGGEVGYYSEDTSQGCPSTCGQGI